MEAVAFVLAYLKSCAYYLYILISTVKMFCSLPLALFHIGQHLACT